jgi:hypothetical protein
MMCRCFVPMKGAVILLAGLLLTACATTTGLRTASQLVGSWRYADETQSCRYSFNADGSFTGEVRLRTKTISRFTGRWAVQDNTLLYTYLRDAFGRIPAGAKDRDRLIEIKNGSFLIEAANGEQRRYLRVR